MRLPISFATAIGFVSEVFTRRLRAMGIRDRPTAPRSPWQNGHAERLIGSIRRECGLANDNDVVQTFAANGTNQSFGKPVLPRRMGAIGLSRIPMARRRCRVSCVRTDRLVTNDNQASGNTDPDKNVGTMECQGACVCDKSKCGLDGTFGVILVACRIPEIHKCTVPKILSDKAAMIIDHLGDQAVVGR